MTGDAVGQLPCWIVVITLLERHITTESLGLRRGIVLIAIQVAIATRGHDDIVPRFRSSDAPFFAAPRHHHGIGRQLPLQDFIPSQQGSALAVEKTRYALREISLQFCHRVQALRLHALLTARTGAPRLARGFVAPDVEVARGKHLHHLAQHIFEENKGLLIAHTQVTVPLLRLRTLQFGIGIQHLGTVSGHLDFGHHRDVTCCRISHDFSQILLGVVAPRSPLVVFVRIALSLFAPFCPICPHTPSRLFGQRRILLDFHAPSSIIGEMQMQTIHLEISHRVQLL